MKYYYYYLTNVEVTLFSVLLMKKNRDPELCKGDQ